MKFSVMASKNSVNKCVTTELEGLQVKRRFLGADLHQPVESVRATGSFVFAVAPELDVNVTQGLAQIASMDLEKGRECRH